MRIPHGPAKAGDAHVAGEARRHAPDEPFRLSPADPPPDPHHHETAAHPHHKPDAPLHETQFELIVDRAELDAAIEASPEESRKIREIEEFQKERRGYNLAGDHGGRFSFFRRGDDGRPAGWFYVKWRAGVSGVLKFLRFIDTWSYLISVPFLIMVLFAIVTSSRGLVHAGSVVVVVVNYGKFWSDLIAFFVRPFKEGPLQGLAFLFPPYGVYFLYAHWDKMKPILKRMLTSCVPIILVVLAYAFIPSVNPEVQDVQDVGTRLKIGTEVLEKDIQGGLKQIEQELSDAAEKKVSPPPPSPR
jgi:hypothetical protein